MINVVLVGHGYWGKILEKYLLSNPRIDLRGVFRGRESLEEMKRFVEKERVEALFIATPTHTHYDFVKWAISNGRHVFCEKPLTNTFKETQELIDLAHQTKCLLFVDYIYRYSEGVIFLKEHLDALGKIKSINMKITQYGNFYQNQCVSKIIGVHMISVLFFLFEEFLFPDEINSWTESYFSSEQHFKINRFKFGKINVYLEENIASLKRERSIEVVGDKGIILFNMLSDETIKMIKGFSLDNNFEILEEDSRYFDEKNNLKKAMDDFCDILVGKKDYVFIKQDLAIANFLQLY